MNCLHEDSDYSPQVVVELLSWIIPVDISVEQNLLGPVDIGNDQLPDLGRLSWPP
jgi:hypothetical protein